MKKVRSSRAVFQSFQAFQTLFSCAKTQLFAVDIVNINILLPELYKLR